MRRTSFILAGIAIALIFSTSAFASEKGGLPALNATVQNLRGDVEVLKTAPAVVGVGFASNDYCKFKDPSGNLLVSLRINAPQDGYVVLTGSGDLGFPSEIDGWAIVTIGLLDSSHEAQTAVFIGDTRWRGETIHPFSLTTVIPVKKGPNDFYMNGFRDTIPGTIWNGYNLKLTAIFVHNFIGTPNPFIPPR